MIKRDGYKRQRSHKRRGAVAGGPLMLNIRVRHLRHRADPKTRVGDVKDALQTLLDTGEMPPGWQFMFVNWKDPERWSGGWRTNYPRHAHSEDAGHFQEHFAAAVQAALRAAEVRKL